MSRWLVSHVPSGVLLAALIVLVVGGAVLIGRFVRRRFPALTRDEHNDVTKFTYGFIGFVYAFFIGFMVSAMWGQITTADGAARDEGAAAVQIARDTVVFDRQDRDRVRRALLDYENAAIAEWDGAGIRTSHDADAALAALYAEVRDIRPTDDTQKAALATSAANLDKLSQARTVRTLTAREDTGPPWPLWAVIFITSSMVVGTVIVYGVERPALHYPMVAIVGIIVATNLFLVLELSHPYIGAVATSSDPLQQVVAVLSRPG
jgi:hypothetical protein